MLRAAAIAGFLFVAACQCGPRCDVTNCAGCCAASGECLPGTHTLACGVDGQQCFTCRSEEQACSNGACVPAPPSGPSGSGGGSPGWWWVVFDGGPGQSFGNLLATIGQPCTASSDTPGGECSAELTCLPVPGTSRFACQFACANGVCGGTGRCQSVSEGARSCTDCLRPCVGNSSCLFDEVCVQRAGGNVCMPNCRLVGAQCPAPQQCLLSGSCSQGGLVSYCLRF